MSNQIGYIDRTWSPIAMRCTPCSDGCKNCWHLRMVKRLVANKSIPYPECTGYTDSPYMTHRINDPLHWRKPQRIAVQFMGDLFHESVPFGFIDRIYEVMATSPQHIYLLLSKRPDRMKTYFESVARLMENPNIFPGVSVSNQPDADRMIPILLQIPAARHWVRYGPALGPVDFTEIRDRSSPWRSSLSLDVLMGQEIHEDDDYQWTRGGKIDFLVAGGETGPGARPAHPDWFRSVRDQCTAARVPFCFEGWGEWLDTFHCGYLRLDCNYLPSGVRVAHTELDGIHFYRVGNRQSGYLLDGREWKELPK